MTSGERPGNAITSNQTRHHKEETQNITQHGNTTKAKQPAVPARGSIVN